VYIEASSITRAKVILKDIRRSSNIGGIGITIKIRMATTATAVTMSLLFEILEIGE
jgi:hypothetical protein